MDFDGVIMENFWGPYQLWSVLLSAENYMITSLVLGKATSRKSDEKRAKGWKGIRVSITTITICGWVYDGACVAIASYFIDAHGTPE